MGIEYEAKVKLSPGQAGSFLKSLEGASHWKVVRSREGVRAFAYVGLSPGEWGEHFAVTVALVGIYVVFHGAAGERDSATLAAIKSALQKVAPGDVHFEEL